MQNDVNLIHEIEAILENSWKHLNVKRMRCFLILQSYFNMQVYKAKCVAMMKMMDDGFDEKAKERKKQNLKILAEKGSLKKRSKKRKIC
ncbi:hypothetical protein RGQ29_014709 [Quercus rubra]|uniref:Uncharacterized protein n=1 Tax=Quercus rubra TaxID=3512 RepID=A0AAN7FPW5_QUERU|nr:hypothetical protein RGQ29_014709 [Quercus rubra]